MNKLKTVLIVASLLLSSSSVFADQCHPEWINGNTQQLTEVERIVCEDKTIASAAVLLGNLYDEKMSVKGKEGHEGMWFREVESNQQDWLEKRNSLKTRDEILDSYMSRIKDLHLERDF